MKRLYSCFLIFALAVCTLGSASAKPKVKYVFYFIGDGMGLNQVLGGSIFASQLEGDKDGYALFPFLEFPVKTYATNRAANTYVTDSAASGTALSTGEKTNNGMIGVLNDGETPVTSVAFDAKKAGVKVGITSNVGVNHATPAAFYAHDKDRGHFYAIGKQLPESGFDFFAGSNFLTDQKDDSLPLLKTVAREAGYTVAFGVDQYNAMKEKTAKMVLFQADSLNSDVPYRIDRKPGDLTLSQITSSAVDFLTNGNDKGFFLMVEGGRIDFAGHSNDAAANFHEVIDLADAVGIALDFYKKYPKETLIVVTADHETGAMSLALNGKYELNLALLTHQKASKDGLRSKIGALRQAKNNRVSWPDTKALLQENLGFWKEVSISMPQEIRLMQAYHESLGEARPSRPSSSSDDKLAITAVSILNEMALIGWSSGGHSAAFIPVFAIGAGSELFSSAAFLDNTDIPKLIAKAAGYSAR
ncbi:MAG: alkaline phosphatase [Bacteroidales bacterium]